MIQTGFQVALPSRGHLRKLAIAVLLAVALGIVVGSGRLPLRDVETRPHLFVAVAVVAVASLLALARVEYGLLSLPVTATAVPIALGTGTGSPLVASLLFAAFLLALFVLRALASRSVVLVSSPLNVPLLGFVVVAVLATVNSEAMRHPLILVWSTFPQVQMGGLSVFVLSAGVLFVTMNSIREMRWIRHLTWVFLGIGALALGGYAVRSKNDLPGFEVGGLFSLWVIALAFGQAVFNHRMPRWGRVGLLLLALGWLYRRFVLETSWLSGWVPAVAAILAISLLRSRLLFSAALAIVAVAALAMYGDIYQTQVIGVDSAGNFLRLDLWQQNLEVTKDHLLLGLGPGGYAPYYVALFPNRALSSHSNYLDVFSQTGLVGSLFFLWVLLAASQVGIRAHRRWPTGFEAGFANAVLGGFLGVVVAMAFGDWLIPFVYNQTIAGFRHTVHSWLFLGALASTLHVDAKEST